MLILNFDICQSCSCSVLTFSETTGLQSDVNETGYGDGGGFTNPEVNDASSATLTITSGTVNYIIDLYNTFPTSDTSFEFNLTNEDFGYQTGQKIPDGIMTFLYTVVIDGVTYTQSKYFGFTCNSKCCVLSLLKKIDWCGCDNTAFNNYVQAKVIFDGLESSKDCGNIVEFNNQLSIMNKICQSNNCGCDCS